jgi:predicted O-methyltransferase YrrM
MTTIEHGHNNGSFIDHIFTFGINLIQSTLVKMRVGTTVERHSERQGIRASSSFDLQLKELGLSPERMWWGPMALFPRKAQFLLSEIEKQPPNRLLEIGSGTSTSLFAALAIKYQFSMLSLENYKETINHVVSALGNMPCEDLIKIQHCGFVRRGYSNGEKYWWYDANLHEEEGKFDFVFIDGPMGSIVGRNGALPEIISHLEKDHRIYLDDYNREHEKLCVKEWQRHYPRLAIETFEECRGIARLRLSY